MSHKTPKITRESHLVWRSFLLLLLSVSQNIYKLSVVSILTTGGPRPPLTYHPWSIEEYTDEQRRMFDVRPGITGWAQVHGRKEVEWHRRIELNVWYVDHVSLWLDIKIVFMTVFKVFTNADNENTTATLVKDNAEANKVKEEEKTSVS